MLLNLATAWLIFATCITAIRVIRELVWFYKQD